MEHIAFREDAAVLMVSEGTSGATKTPDVLVSLNQGGRTRIDGERLDPIDALAGLFVRIGVWRIR